MYEIRVIAKCLVCGKDFEFESEMCCSGENCCCGGRPVEPQVCSSECFNKI